MHPPRSWLQLRRGLAMPRVASLWSLGLSTRNPDEAPRERHQLRVMPMTPLLSTIGGAPPATLGSNGYTCEKCARRVRLELLFRSSSPLRADSDRTVAQIALALLFQTRRSVSLA